MIRLPHDATAAELQDLCETYAARLAAWIDAGERPRARYDGTVGSLCDLFETHAQSPIREVKRNTAQSYIDSLKVIRASVAKRAVRAVVPIDVKTWYARWRAPAEEGGKERIKRAHDAVSALRMVLRFGLALGHEECGKLAEGLKAIQFERSGARSGEMTFAQAKSFIDYAVTQGPRGLHMAIGVAAQFETLLRQKDVIGEWTQTADGDRWTGTFTWENIPGGIYRLRTSKTNKEIEHDLTRLGLLWPLLQRVPQAERHGAIVKGELGLPVRERSYRKWFRQLATGAGLPDGVWNMDARAGAITEALNAGAEETAVQRAATHSAAVMTRRYDRKVKEAVADVAEARKKAREQ